MKIHADSHLDHNLTPAHVAFLRSHFAGKTGFFIETVPGMDAPTLVLSLAMVAQRKLTSS